VDPARVWITGVGVVTSLGRDVAATWPRLLAGERGLGPVTAFETTADQRSRVVAEVKAPWDDGPAAEEGVVGWSRTSLFAWRAAREALAAAELGGASEWASAGRRVGLVVGGTTGGMFETELLLAELSVSLAGQVERMTSQPLTATGDRLLETLGPFCRVRTVCSACSSGANAFVIGASWLLAGEVDAVLVGGADGLCRLTLTGFNALAATDPEPCRPFDVRRRGLNLGEGAGFAVLERAASVEARGGPVVAELAGWGVGAEAHHITNPDPTGAAAGRVIAQALARAGLSPRDVDYVNAHGTATPLNDAMETNALRAALGDEVARVLVSSSKGQVGHTLGAAGAVEAVLTALAIREERVPPTMGLEEPDPACALAHVLERGRRAQVRAALSNSFGFGGMNTVLALTAPGFGPGRAPTTAPRRVVVTGVAALSAHGLDTGFAAAALVDGRAAGSPPHGRLPVDLTRELQVERARRLDRPARLGAVVVGAALEAAAAPTDRSTFGLVLGTAFGSLDPTAAYLRRLGEKGPRLASPAEFPNLVPSSVVGHVSIYHGLRGPTLATADLGTSGESALMTAVELIATGVGDALVAGAVEDASDIVERALPALLGEVPRGGVERSEGAAALVLEEEQRARVRGARALARLTSWTSWTEGSVTPVRRIPPPRDPSRARVVWAGSAAGGPEHAVDVAWSKVPSTRLSPVVGSHEGLGATALAAAVSLVAEGSASEVLVVGRTRGRGYAFALASPTPRGDGDA
jgi:3-oxoacyl-[acyl-carrier-protein] synthase II